MGEEDWRDFWGLFVGAIEDEKAVKNGGNLVGVENTIAPGFVSTLMLDSVSEPVSHNIFFFYIQEMYVRAAFMNTTQKWLIYLRIYWQKVRSQTKNFRSKRVS